MVSKTQQKHEEGLKYIQQEWILAAIVGVLVLVGDLIVFVVSSSSKNKNKKQTTKSTTTDDNNTIYAITD